MEMLERAVCAEALYVQSALRSLIIRPHRSTTYVDVAYIVTDVAWSVCGSLCLSRS